MAQHNNFQLDLTPLVNLIRRSPSAGARGVTTGMRDIKRDWVREARDVAPLDTGNLRHQIKGTVKGSGVDAVVEIEANAMNSQYFNYAYYIHEGHMEADGKSLRHAGTVEEFLNDPAKQNEHRWRDILEREIREQLEREGW